MTPISLDQPWGRGFKAAHTHSFASDQPQIEKSTLPRGLGRSYGDVCVNDGGALLHTFRRDRLLAFDDATGVLTCEAGASLADVAQTLLPRGWFLPVVPGTRYVTVGGAIANDVHGKNHHGAGNFGRFVKSVQLHRSDWQTTLAVAPSDAMFPWVIGGIGLSGLISEATVQMKPVPGPASCKRRSFLVATAALTTTSHLMRQAAPGSTRWAGSTRWIVACAACFFGANIVPGRMNG